MEISSAIEQNAQTRAAKRADKTRAKVRDDEHASQVVDAMLKVESVYGGVDAFNRHMNTARTTILEAIADVSGETDDESKEKQVLLKSTLSVLDIVRAGALTVNTDQFANNHRV